MEKRQRVAAYALVVVEDHILMVKMGKGPNHGRWALPGGGIEFGEHPLECLKREIVEETGISVSGVVLDEVISTLVDWTDDSGATIRSVQNVGIIYRASSAGLETVKADADGFSSLGSKWIPIKELKKSEVSTVFQAYLEQQGIF